MAARIDASIANADERGKGAENSRQTAERALSKKAVRLPPLSLRRPQWHERHSARLWQYENFSLKMPFRE
jgi:hypothetical protein